MSPSSQSHPLQGRRVTRALWLCQYVWPNLVVVLLLFPLAWYALPPLMELPLARIAAIVATPFVAFFIYYPAYGFFLGSAARSFGSGFLNEEQAAKMARAEDSIESLASSELNTVVVEAEHLALLNYDAQLGELFVSPQSLDSLSAKQIEQLLYAQLRAADTPAPWILGRLFNFSSLIALIPAYTMHYTDLPDTQGPLLLLSCALLGFVAMCGARLAINSWREGEGDRDARDGYGREEYIETLSAWAAHLQLVGGSGAGYKRLARLSRMR